MHSIIITPYALQGSIFAHSFKRHNIQSLVCSPESLRYDWHPRSDSIFIPHTLSENHVQVITPFLSGARRNTPVVSLGRQRNSLKNTIQIDERTPLDEIPQLLKEIINKNTKKKTLGKHMQSGPLVLDRRKRTLYNNGQVVFLTRKEFSLLELLMMNEGCVTTRDNIIDYVWDKRNFVAQNTIDVYISRLRRKLRPNKKAQIHTIPCLGYQFQIQ